MQVTEPRAPEPDWSGWETWLRSHLDIQRDAMADAFGEALGVTYQELRDRISALELKLAELTGAIDILRATTPSPERDTRAFNELLSTERRTFGDLLERRTREFELKLAELTGAVDILRGAQPPPPVQFPSVKAFSTDTIYHEGDIVAFAGSTYQAAKDTVRVPGAQDWVCLAVAGAGFTIRSTYDGGEEYKQLDVVTTNGSSFVALKDAPGPCPGSEWQLLASRGSRGDRGLKGEQGPHWTERRTRRSGTDHPRLEARSRALRRVARDVGRQRRAAARAAWAIPAILRGLAEMTEWNEIQRRVALTPEVIAARIELRVAELRVLAARTFVLAARAQKSRDVPNDIRLAAKADVARAIATAIAKRKQR